VTVDYKDYSFAGVYTRLIRAGDAETRPGEEGLPGAGGRGFRASREGFAGGVRPGDPQILLIHCNELNR